MGKYSKTLGEDSPGAAPSSPELSEEDSLMVSASIAYHSLLAVFLAAVVAGVERTLHPTIRTGGPYFCRAPALSARPDRHHYAEPGRDQPGLWENRPPLISASPWILLGSVPAPGKEAPNRAWEVAEGSAMKSRHTSAIFSRSPGVRAAALNSLSAFTAAFGRLMGRLTSFEAICEPKSAERSITRSLPLPSRERFSRATCLRSQSSLRLPLPKLED